MITRSFALRSFALLPALLLAGCALTPGGTPSAAHGLSLQGKLHGGQQPIAGAHVYLLAASSSGYGTPSVSLLDPNITGFSDSVGAFVPTDQSGAWNISGDYICTPNSQVYVLALGGDPGAGVNSASGLLAVLGNCPSTGNFASATPFVWVNEVSTVAAAYALSGYATDSLHVASSGTPLALTGIANAFALAGNLADLSSGSALATTPNGNGTVPAAQINTLANILAACINSTGPGSGSCSTLLGDATSDGTPSGTVPADTASAMFNIVHNPGANLADLFNLPPAVAPFAPSLTIQPNDFTLGIAYTGSLNAPASVAIDAAGNAWISNQAANSVAVLSPLGIPVAGSPFSGNGLNAPGQLALDNLGNAWVANNGASSISAFSASGSPLAGSPFSGGGLNAPDALAVDPLGSVWVADPGSNNVTVLTAGIPTAISGDGLTAPFGVSIDQSGNAWIVNQAANSVTILAPNGTPWINSPVTGNGISTPFGISVDGAGSMWIANLAANSLTVLDHTGNPLSGSPFTGAGLNGPASAAFDGGGNVWVANSGSQGVTELTGSGSAVLGSPFLQPSLASPFSIAVDGAGSVWLANSGANTVTQLLGAAIPTVTPVAAALSSNSIGARP